MNEDKKIIITGASSGVGLSLCKLFHKKGFEVITVSRRKPDVDFPLSHYTTDLSDSNQTKSSAQKIKKEHGSIAYLINNAGVMIPGEVTGITDAQLNQAINVNALSALTFMQEFLPEMQKNNFGRIINLTSGAPLNCFPGYAAYSATKALLNAITVTAAKENSERNIKINLMSPGPVRSEMSPAAKLEPEICHPTIEYLMNLDEKGATGKFFWLGYEVPLFPDLAGVNWLEGIGNEKLIKVL